MRVAFSNPAFELWYLLHFVMQTAALTRRDCQRRLTAHLSRPYRKNDPLLYDALEPHLEQALGRAQRLEAAAPQPLNPAAANPLTTVHHLVAELLRGQV